MATEALLTDLYELTMLQANSEQRMNGRAVFELFVRRLPTRRNFVVAAGLAQVLDYLAALRFATDDLAWLNGCGRFTLEFVDSLAGLRFTGDVDALPEGTVYFADEPILRISAPLREAQLVEKGSFPPSVGSITSGTGAPISSRARPGLPDTAGRRAHQRGQGPRSYPS